MLNDLLKTLFGAQLDWLKRDENRTLATAVGIALVAGTVWYAALTLKGDTSSPLGYASDLVSSWLGLMIIGLVLLIAAFFFIRIFTHKKFRLASALVLVLSGLSFIVAGVIQMPTAPGESKYIIAIVQASPVSKGAEEESFNFPHRIRDELANRFSDNRQMSVSFHKDKVVKGVSDEEQKKTAIELCKSLRVHMLIWGEIRVESGSLKVRTVITRNPDFPRKRELHVPDDVRNPLHEVLERPESLDPSHRVFKTLLAHEVADVAALVCGLVYYENGKWDQAIGTLKHVSEPYGRYYEAKSLLERSWHSKNPMADITLALNLFQQLQTFCENWQLASDDQLCWSAKAGKARALSKMADLSSLEQSSQFLREAVALEREVSQALVLHGLTEERAIAQINLGLSLIELGSRLAGSEGKACLVEAVRVLSSAGRYFSDKGIVSRWAHTEYAKGTTLRLLSEREDPQNRLKFLRESEEAHRKALKTFSSEKMEFESAITQINLGSTLLDLSRGQSKGEALAYLNEAMEVFRKSETVFTELAFPNQWAGIQNNVGLVLCDLGQRSSYDESNDYFRWSIQCFNQSLKVYSRDRFPRQWTMVQSNMGVSWYQLSKQVGDEEKIDCLEKAKQAWNDALATSTMNDDPVSWARIQNNFGNALRNIGMINEGQEGISLLEKAAAAYRSALTVRTKEAFPAEHAMTQNNLGIALTEIARRSILKDPGKGSEEVEQAVASFRAALEIYEQLSFLHEWTDATCSLAYALGLGSSEIGTDSLVEAVKFYENALQVYSFDRNPEKWAHIRQSIGNLLTRACLRSSQTEVKKEQIKRAIENLVAASQVFTEINAPDEFVNNMKSLGMAYAILGDLSENPDNCSNYQNKALECVDRARRFLLSKRNLEEIKRIDDLAAMIKEIGQSPPQGCQKSEDKTSDSHRQ